MSSSLLFRAEIARSLHPNDDEIIMIECALSYSAC